jgi:hypothetical protein
LSGGPEQARFRSILTRIIALADNLVDSHFKSGVETALRKLPNIEELCEVTLYSHIRSLVSATDMDALLCEFSFVSAPESVPFVDRIVCRTIS